LTESLGLAKQVFFIGPVRDRQILRAWNTRADLFLFPSTFDTNGLVVREAAASDTASVIIAGSCASEGVTDGRNGFLIEENSASLAAKLTELAARPGLMKEVGRNAGSELYISWENAVANAYERYLVVIDNYKSGVYGRRDLLRGSWMQSQGELMQILGDIGAAGRDLRNDMLAVGREIQNDMKEFNKDVREGLDNLRSGIRNQIRETGDEIWEKLERYL
jgi:hypothetical protein